MPNDNSECTNLYLINEILSPASLCYDLNPLLCFTLLQKAANKPHFSGYYCSAKGNTMCHGVLSRARSPQKYLYLKKNLSCMCIIDTPKAVENKMRTNTRSTQSEILPRSVLGIVLRVDSVALSAIRFAPIYIDREIDTSSVGFLLSLQRQSRTRPTCSQQYASSVSRLSINERVVMSAWLIFFFLGLEVWPTKQQGRISHSQQFSFTWGV